MQLLPIGGHPNCESLTLKLLLMLSIFVGCTPFKLSSYQECDNDRDCIDSFEVCNASKLCQTEGALCRWSTSYEAPLTSTSNPGGPVIGVLANDSKFSVEGSQSSAYLGIHTGLAVVSGTNQPTFTLLICNPDPQYRDLVLETFREHQARIVIGSPELIDLEDDGVTTSNAEAYISLGLNPASSDSSASGWLNLRPNYQELERAFESVSTNVIDYLIDQENAFNVILPVAQATPQPDYMQDLIWRMSPYMESIFRTLVVYYQPDLIIDDDIQAFLNTPRPLRLLVSYSPLDEDKLTALAEVATQQSISPSAQGPLFMYAASWDVKQMTTVPQGYWSSVIKMSIIYDQYQELNIDATNTEALAIQKLQEGAFDIATQLGGGNPLGTPYFGLAYDAGVIAGLVSLASLAGQAPRDALDRLTSSEDLTQDPLYLSKEQIEQLISSTNSMMTGRRLVGMSGQIKGSLTRTIEPHAMIFVCSKDGQPPHLFPIERLAEVEDGQNDDIIQRFKVSEEALIQCERQQ